MHQYLVLIFHQLQFIKYSYCIAWITSNVVDIFELYSFYQTTCFISNTGIILDVGITTPQNFLVFAYQTYDFFLDEIEHQKYYLFQCLNQTLDYMLFSWMNVLPHALAHNKNEQNKTSNCPRDFT